MSEEKKPKTVDDLQKEYTNLCTKAGHLQYQISTLKAELELVNSALKNINIEASQLAAEAKKEEKPSENS